MKILVFATQKGGAGKTTLVSNIAIEAVKQGESVLIIDLDPQQSISKWWERRDADTPDLIKINSDDLDQALKMARDKGYTFACIDTAGSETLTGNSAILAADFCIVPCQPSVVDIEASTSTFRLLSRMNKDFAFVLTRCPARGKDAENTKKGLVELGKVAKSTTIERKAYKHAFATGLSVTEYDKKDKASAEIIALYDEITTFLTEAKRG